MFQVLNLTDIHNHANTFSFHQSLDFQIHREEEFIKLHGCVNSVLKIAPSVLGISVRTKP
jgi:hypothetical protein